MNELQADGRVEHIGVSNFDVDQLQQAMAVSETPIVTNQVEQHPYHQHDLLAAHFAALTQAPSSPSSTTSR